MKKFIIPKELTPTDKNITKYVNNQIHIGNIQFTYPGFELYITIYFGKIVSISFFSKFNGEDTYSILNKFETIQNKFNNYDEAFIFFKNKYNIYYNYLIEKIDSKIKIVKNDSITLLLPNRLSFDKDNNLLDNIPFFDYSKTLELYYLKNDYKNYLSRYYSIMKKNIFVKICHRFRIWISYLWYILLYQISNVFNK
jgi:hypothetical protein